jgi:hypothetical protein
MNYIVGGEQSGDFLYFSTAPELPRTRVRQGERTDLPNLLSSESHHQQSASQEGNHKVINNLYPSHYIMLTVIIPAVVIISTRETIV